jgi:hypothetical protein
MKKPTRFPDWSPKYLVQGLLAGDYDHDPDLVALTIRLLTYPEMEYVWKTIRDWRGGESVGLRRVIEVANEGENASLVEELEHIEGQYEYESLFGYAVNHIQRTNKPATLPPRKRKAAIERVAKHAKQLRNSLSELAMPDNILWYFPWDSVLKVFEQSSVEIIEHLEDVEIVYEQKDMDYSLDCFIPYYREESALTEYYKRGFSLRELLTILADEEEMDLRLPSSSLKTSKFGNEKRLALIRDVAFGIKRHYGISAREEREFIANFARTVLDDAGIDESVVKDALRGIPEPDQIVFKPLEEQHGNGEKK